MMVPKKGKYTRTDEIKNNMSRLKKDGYADGKLKSWNKGRKENRKEVLEKQSKSHIGQSAWNKGKTDLPKHSEEHKEKIRKKLKGRIISEDHRKNMSKGRIGMKFSEKHKKQISMSKKGVPNYKTRGKKHSEETKLKISESRKGKAMNNKNRLGHTPSEETKKKLRLAAIKYINEHCGGITPMLGHNEKGILDELQEEYGYDIIRQYQVEGYFLDGYIKELKLAIEVYEKPKDKERDIRRQQQIEKKLGCKFLRIRDYNKRTKMKGGNKK